MPLVMGVRKTEFHALVRSVPFLALPREEIHRLHAAIEVLAVDHETLRQGSELIPLHSYVAIHHNYSWLTFRHGDNERTLLLSSALSTDGPAPLFLGEELIVAAQRDVEERLALDGGYDVRLAGMLQETEGHGPPSVGLLSIARLAGRITRDRAECYGNFELRSARSQFDRLSQIVIDYLEAL